MTNTPSLSDLLREISEARTEVNEAEEILPSQIQLKLMAQDTGHLKWLVYLLTAAFLLAIGAGWQLYLSAQEQILHLDNKIEHKMDYLNSRIDSNLQKENDHIQPVTIPKALPEKDQKE